jgi:hypothetical protein
MEFEEGISSFGRGIAVVDAIARWFICRAVVNLVLVEL